MEFRFSSQKIEQRLLHLFPSKIIIVQSIDEDGRCLYLQPSPKAGQNDSQVADSTSSLMVPGTLKSSEKEDPKVAMGQSQQANNDVNKSTDLSLRQPQQSTKSIKPDVTSKQQGSEPSNLSASQRSKVSMTSESAQAESHHESSGDILDRSVFEQETPAGDSKTVTPSSAKLEMELTWKKKHTVHCFLHHFKVKCNLCETAEECQEYDEGFASMFNQFLDKNPNASLPSANNEDTPGVDFMKYIEVHLQAKKCPSPCSRLWRYCADNKLFYLFKYAPEGLLIHSNSQPNAVGTVIDTYLGYRNKSLNMIGFGGFGKVYEFSDERAVKEEFKQPLINGSTQLFQRIMKLKHPNVIKVLEYITGPSKDENKCFLSVMPFKNRKDLQKQFTKEKHLTSVLDYMTVFQDQKKYIFRNYTVMFRHVFEGLCYLKNEGIIHRDIKPSNILVHQNCACQSPLQCTCDGDGDGDVTYLLGDMDLLSLEEESAESDLTYTYTLDEWQKMAYHDPAGTIGMKPPESFFRTKKGDRVTNHKSDVWSACVTMMNVLIGKGVNEEAQQQIRQFIAAATEGTKAALKSVTESLSLLGSIITKFKSVFNQMKTVQENSELVNNDMSDLNAYLNKLKQLLTSGEKGLHQSQSFQGGFCEIYKEESPLAGILTTAHGAQVLHWKCFTKLEEIQDTQLWNVMKQILDAIVAGIKFVPDRRQDATEIINRLKRIPSLDCSDNEQRAANN